MLTKKLSDFKVGEKGIVLSVSGNKVFRRRLFDMGITPNCEIYLRKKAPLGDPIELTLRGYELTIRKNDAKNITMIIQENA